MPGNKGRAGQCTITHGPQQHAARAGHRALAGADTSRHLTGAHALEADVLILDYQIQQHGCSAQNAPTAPRPPGGQAVGVQGDPQAFRQALFIQRRHQACKSRSSRRTCCTWLSSRRPISVGVGGVARTSTGWPTRASSSLMRWDIADCDRPSTWPPVQNRPVRPPRPGQKAIYSRTSVFLMSDQQDWFFLYSLPRRMTSKNS